MNPRRVCRGPTQKMKAAIWHGGRDIRIEDLPMPRAGPDEVVVNVRAVGICGSELHAYEGRSKRRIPPLVMGHEFAGTVVEAGERTTGISVGDRVAVDPAVPCGICEQCLHGRANVCRARRHVGLDFPGAFAEHVKMPGRACYRIPDSMPFDVATLAEPMSVGVHAVRVGSIDEQDVVLIIGSGIIGLSSLIAGREKAKRMIVSDLLDSRLALARSFGSDATIDASKVDAVQELQSLNEGKSADVVVEAVGLEKTIAQAISSVREAGRVVLVGLLDETARLNILQITLREIQLKGSYGRTSEDLRIAVALLGADLSAIRRLITHTFPLDNISHAFETMSREKRSTMKVVVVP